MSQEHAGTVYAVEEGGRNVYCNCTACISGLLGMSWRLSDPRQLSHVAQGLAGESPPSTHAVSAHLQ
jgi:hypothetical protein